MKPADVSEYLEKEVIVDNAKMKAAGLSNRYMLTAYIFRKMQGKKVYQAEIRNLNPPHEIYIVSLDDVTAAE